MTYRHVQKIEKALRKAAEDIDKHFKLESAYKTRVYRNVTDPKAYWWILEMTYGDWVSVSTGDGIKFTFSRSGTGCINQATVCDGEDTWETLAELVGIVGCEIKLMGPTSEEERLRAILKRIAGTAGRDGNLMEAVEIAQEALDAKAVTVR
jgi:hypothetical protein